MYDEHSAAVMVAKLVTSVHEFPTTFTKVFWGGAVILHTHGVVALHEAELVVSLLYCQLPPDNIQPLGSVVASTCFANTSPRAAACAEHSVSDKMVLPESVQEPAFVSVIKNGIGTVVLHAHA